jgi:WD40 repeat protein
LNDNGQNAHRDRITDLKLSPDRTCLVSSSADGTAKVWDANTKELISKLIGHKREVAKQKIFFLFLINYFIITL